MSEESQQSRSRTIHPVLTWGGTLITVYLMFFGLLYLDGMILETNFFSQYVFTSTYATQVVVWLYWPLLKLFGFI